MAPVSVTQLALSEVFKSRGGPGGPCVSAKAGDRIWAVTLSFSFHLHSLLLNMSHTYNVHPLKAHCVQTARV